MRRGSGVAEASCGSEPTTTAQSQAAAICTAALHHTHIHTCVRQYPTATISVGLVVPLGIAPAPWCEQSENVLAETLVPEKGSVIVKDTVGACACLHACMIRAFVAACEIFADFRKRAPALLAAGAPQRGSTGLATGQQSIQLG